MRIKRDSRIVDESSYVLKMTGIRLAIFFLAVGVDVSTSLSLPSYIVPCHMDDPDLSECTLKHANAAIPYLAKGDKRYHFPALNPLRLPEAKIENGQNFRLKLTNISIYGLETMKITKLKFYPEKLTTVLTMSANNITCLANYEIDGRILLLPISGVGTARMAFADPTFNLTWVMGTKKVNGETYLKFVDASVNYDLQGATYKIDNLFNGNKELGDEMNKVLNENWRALHEEFSPALCAVIVKITRQIGENVMTTVPLNKIFL